MPTFKIVVAYDGTDFIGWQRQASGVSIQGLLEDALGELDARHVDVIGAGRTDAGVHAIGQVASFFLEREIDPRTLARALNAHLPHEIRVMSAAEAAPGFHARFDARSKTYRYRMWNDDAVSPFERRYAWHLVGPIDFDAMADAARRIHGVHDFAAFQAAGTDVSTTVRNVLTSELRIADGGSRIADGGLGIGNLQSIHNPQSAIFNYEITATGFLRHMIRAIVGSLVEVGRGRREPEWIDELIASRDRTRAGPTAPAHGLFLASVEYGVALADEP